ncbi:acetylornithine deacetylase [Sneathiella sp. DP05]|uniref:Acetylornithine deacetylase n=2 Tax=Sneathiella litorea TaxID=2606216 RepID=A0A6L8W9I2_9PROT|nr:acetylornithine deacetylase [Sneathiella litorea]
MIEKLVSFDTVSRNSNLNLIDFVSDYLEGHGITATRVFNEDKSKANLYATVGPVKEGGVVLSGHTDVVPVEGQPWDTDPFTVVEKDGRLYGRGTSDMKSFSAIALSKVPEMLEKGLSVPIHFALSYDEEIGCVGAPDMIDEIAANLPAPRAVIVGEPTMMDIVSAHKGILTLKTTVTGREAHSSLVEDGVSAVMVGADLIHFISGMMAENKARSSADSPFSPPYSTLTCGVVHGGTAGNIIARECSFLWDIRYIPEDDPMNSVNRFNAYCETEVLPELRKIAPESSIVTEISSTVPALRPEDNGEAEMLCRAITGKNTANAVSYAAEAGQFQQAGFSTVICGPGSIGVAHQPNEYIDISQVKAAEDFISKLIDRLVI